MRSDWRRNKKTYAMVKTDRLEQALAASLSDLYKEAGNDIAKMARKFQMQFSAADIRMRNQLAEGKITESYYKAWRSTQMGKSQRWETMKGQMADRMNNADLQAAAYINSTSPSIYALNHDYTCYQIHDAGLMEGGSFTLTNERAVRELVLGGNHVNFRTMSLNPVRNYNWNAQRVQQVLTRGILTGKSIDGIAADFLQIMGRNEAAAVRNARTAVTSAQAAGCQEAFDEAAEMGIEFEKEWISTHDDRTRDSHLELDGERVANDEEFSNGLMYPGDPKGEPGEVYNCRCTMRAVLPGTPERKMNEEEKLYTEWRDQQQEIEGEKSIDQKEVELLNAAENEEKTETVEVEIQDKTDEISGTELNNEDKNGKIEAEEVTYSGLQNPLKFDMKNNTVIVEGKEFTCRIKDQKQKEHIPGTKEYFRRVEKDANGNGKHGHHSEFFENVDIVKLIYDAQNGDINDTSVNASGVTAFFNAEEKIGYFYTGGEKVETRRYGVRFGSDGCHAFPVQSKEK